MKIIGLSFFLLSFSFFYIVFGNALVAEQSVEQKNISQEQEWENKTSQDLVRLAWAASNQANYIGVDEIFNVGIQKFESQAMAQHQGLENFPTRDKINSYQTMNDVAVLYFIRAEALMHQGKTEESIALFNDLKKQYPFAQAWDPSRGSYWSIAEKSQESIDVMTGEAEKKAEALRSLPITIPSLAKTGKNRVIDYTQYGKFTGIGTKDYAYQMGNPSLLSEAVGEGIYPNTMDVLKNPRYRELYKEGRLKGNHWDYVNTRDYEAAFFKWATAQDNPGVKLFYTAMILERAKMFAEAIKAYHALIVHFPKSFGMTYWQTPWYPAQAAVYKIKSILRLHPELNMVYQGGKIQVINGADNCPQNDIFIVDPGVLIDTTQLKGKIKEKPVKLGGIKRRLGGKKAEFIQYKNGHWKMLVDGKPFMIKGITYAPTKVGQTPDKGTLENWMVQDANKNGRIDSPYEAWVDKNKNNMQDEDEPSVGDFQLMKDMGVNTIRIYHNDYKEVNHELLKDLHCRYGISVIVGNFLGKYAHGSGADWATGTDYENEEHLANMMKDVEEMVLRYKDEPYVIMWLLGNENNYGVASNADKKPKAYFKFANKVAKRIKELDPTRPVALCNGDVLFLDVFAKHAPDIDAFGANIYRGDYGFGAYWDEVRMIADRPAFITEYGAPAYSQIASLEEAEEEQASYHRAAWLDIMANAVGVANGEGNAVGGIVFEWLDEWWKNYEPARHDTKADVIGPFAGGFYFEEWFGVVGQGDVKNTLLMRHLRKAYFVYQELWHEKLKK